MKTRLGRSAFSWILTATLLCLPRVALTADETEDLDKVSVEIETSLRQGRHHDVYYAGLSKRTGIEVSVLERQRAKHRLGYGDFAIAHLVAKDSGQPFEVIVAERRSKQGWGAIAKGHGVKLGPIVSAARKSSQSLKEKGRDLSDAPAEKGKKPSSGAEAHKPTDSVHGNQDFTRNESARGKASGDPARGSTGGKGKGNKGGGRQR